jgi:uncharacterized OB-fold protein
VVENAVMHDVEGEPRLIGGSCATCDRRSFPVATTCAWCGADTVTTVDLAPTGRLWGWTAVTAAPPGYEGRIPFGFGVVELDDGLRVITRLTEPDPSVLTYGQRMHLVADRVGSDEDGSDVVAWAFAPGEV